MIYNLYKNRLDSLVATRRSLEDMIAKGSEIDLDRFSPNYEAELKLCSDFLLNYFEIGEKVQVSFLSKEFVFSSYVGVIDHKGILNTTIEPVFGVLVEGETMGKTALGSQISKLVYL